MSTICAFVPVAFREGETDQQAIERVVLVPVEGNMFRETKVVAQTNDKIPGITFETSATPEELFDKHPAGMWAPEMRWATWTLGPFYNYLTGMKKKRR